MTVRLKLTFNGGGPETGPTPLNTCSGDPFPPLATPVPGGASARRTLVGGSVAGPTIGTPFRAWESAVAGVGADAGEPVDVVPPRRTVTELTQPAATNRTATKRNRVLTRGPKNWRMNSRQGRSAGSVKLRRRAERRGLPTSSAWRVAYSRAKSSASPRLGRRRVSGGSADADANRIRAASSYRRRGARLPRRRSP